MIRKKSVFVYTKTGFLLVKELNMKKIGKLEIIEFLNGLVFYSPVSLLVRTRAGVSMSEFFILQVILAFVILSFEIPTANDLIFT